MIEIFPGIFLGDYSDASNISLLQSNGIKRIISAIKEPINFLSNFKVLKIPIDDLPTSNLIEYFNESNQFINDAVKAGEALLIHCQAGQSRSVSLLISFLQFDRKISTFEALNLIKSKKADVEPSKAFINQLEMYSRCKNEWNPSIHLEQRRFLLEQISTKIQDGTSPASALADYSLNSNPLTEKSAGKQVETDQNIPGRRIRCKMCRHVLAGREDVINHEIGKGQHAFAPRRRDMRVYRSEQEKFRVDEKLREQKERIEDRTAYETLDAAAAAVEALKLAAEEEEEEKVETSSTIIPIVAPPPVILGAGSHPAIAGLRISMPKIENPGRRIPFARPTAPLPTPASIAKAALLPSTTSVASPATPLVDSVLSTASLSSVSSSIPINSSLATTEKPLLPSHLCSSYFLEPLEWMTATLEPGIHSGKLLCPNEKCLAKLGSYDWSGSQCSCGAWILPAFAVGCAKVDEILI